MCLGKAGKYLVGICLHGGCGEKRSRNGHKFLRTTSCKTGITYCKQKGTNQIYPFSDRQQ